MKKLMLLYCSLVVIVALQAQSIQTNLDTLDFGILYSGFDISDTLEVEVTNVGLLDLLIYGVSTSPGVFTAYPSFAGIDPGDSETFTVVFTPLSTGGYSGVLIFTSNDPTAQKDTIVLIGQSLVPPEISVSPQTLSAVLFSGKITTQPLTISNTGGSNLNFTITPGDGNQNFALEFDGSDDCIDFGNNIDLANSSFTLEVWTKEGFPFGGHFIWGQGNSGNANMCLHVGFRDNGVFTFAFYCNDLDVPSIYQDTAWHHWACTFDVSTQVRKIYRDGIQVASDLSTANYQGSGNFYIGRDGWGSNFLGCIDDARIWNIVRTQDDIQQHMGYELLGNEPGLVGYWDFDEGTGSTVNDKSPNSNNGSLMNGVTWTNSSAPMSPGWISVNPESDTIPMNSSEDIQVTFDASYLSGGDYLTNIAINSNDPADPEVLIPVTLHVIDAPSIFADQDTLSFGEVFVGYGDTLELVVENTGSQDLLIFSAEAEPSKYSVFPLFSSIDPGETEIFTITFLPQSVGNYPGTLTFTSNDPLYEEYVITLEGTGIAPPVISVVPDSLLVDILAGDSVSIPFMIYNTGGSNLYFTITPGEGSQHFALEFDGSDDYIDLGNNIDLANSSITLEVWAKEGTTYGNQFVWGQCNSGNGNMCLHVGFRESGVFTFAFYGNDLDTPNIYQDTAWHHWACTFDVSTKVRKIYREGIQVASDISPANYQGNGTFEIGRAGGGSNFTGCIDDARIWNIVRTQDDIQQHMGYELLGNEPGLVGYWNFDEGEGSIVNDKSPNGINGSLINGVTWTSSSAPMSAAWLSVGQQAGTIPAGSYLDIGAIFNANEMEAGDYQADLRISSNDPANNLVTIPVHMIVGYATGIEKPPIDSHEWAVQCYPNPFRDYITFDYELVETGMVDVTVFNYLGQRVEVVINEKQMQGKHIIKWHNRSLPAGLYYYRIEAGTLTGSGKMVKY